MEYNVDATNAIAGRLGTKVAKEALQGKTVNVVNAEKAIISGTPERVFERYHYLRTGMGQQHKGPFIPRMPDRFLKRLFRGMLPYKKGRGAEAFKRIKCHIGVPDEFKDKKIEKYEDGTKKLPTLKYSTIQSICRKMGGKV
jgi:large subunit ribosomal protein L13